MKKVILTFALCLGCATAFAQVLTVTSMRKVSTESGKAVVAGISPKGDYLLITDARNNGLSKLDLATGATTQITDAPGAGYNAQISDDGTQVVYRKNTFKNHLRKTAVLKHDLASGAASQLVAESRHIQGVAIDGDAAVTINKGKATVKSLGARKAKAQNPVFSIANGALMMTVGSRTTVFSPNGTNYRYIWPSLSPDKTRVLYYVSGVGAFVADLKGNMVAELGAVRAPKWLGNNVVVGMHDTDNGEVVTASEIVAVDLAGNRQVLTDDSMIAMYPHASADGSKIAFSTIDGEAYIIDINNK